MADEDPSMSGEEMIKPEEAVPVEEFDAVPPLEPTAPPEEYQEVPQTILKPSTNVSLPPDLSTPESISPSPHVDDPAAKIHAPTIFGCVPERCVVFCIDTSGSMFNSIHVVKEHLMETLSSMAARDDQPMFNLIEFNSQVTQWADKMVQCTPETVAVARKWVGDLTAKTGTNTQDALLTALADPACEAVYLVSDGLPDQFADDVLDRVVSACGRRCIHCIYLTGETADEAATEFLEDLAVETFGSFHIVTLTTHGCVERITPIYRSDHAHERIVHTVNNTLRPNIKTCGISTTLQVDPDEIIDRFPRAASLAYNANPFFIPPALLSTYPSRYYYPYYWSRYRPAKTWLKAQEKLADPLLGLSPAAGSLLVGKKVIARRIEDGYFYKATVQSQNLGEKFLVAFGPCKHGKYRQTQYQDTHVFDIVDYYDALRHTIITGDRVLAPWEPEGERFAPGIVLEGQEKRQADGPDDKELTISFSNGHTEKIPADMAVWVPASVYERLALELQMPKDARQTLLSTADQYPIENLPGYPPSGAHPEPREYPRADPFVVDASPYVLDPYLYRYPPLLRYGYPPFLISRKEREGVSTKAPGNDGQSSAADGASAIIPGTNMTQQELDDRVMSQLMEHSLVTKASRDTNQRATSEVTMGRVSHSPTRSRLLGRRVKADENLLKKSVTFNDRITSLEEEPNADFVSEDDYEDAFDEYGLPQRNEDYDFFKDSRFLFYTSPGIKGRPRWNYWRNDPSPSYSQIKESEDVSTRSKSPGPFRETALAAPLEARDQREPPYNVEWPNSAFKYVDTLAKHDYSNSVEECLNTPKPPPKSNAGTFKRSYTVASRPVADMTPEEREEARRAHRRRRVIQREEAWQSRLAEQDHMKDLMQDQHRERVVQQIERDQQRQKQEQEDIQRAREGKKRISREIRARIEQNQRDEMDRENRRIESMTKRRERRDELQQQRDKEIQDTIRRREEIRKQNNEKRLSSWTEHLNEQEAKEKALTKQHKEAKLNRVHHFRELERKGQEKKDLRIAVKEQHQALQLSQIFA